MIDYTRPLQIIDIDKRHPATFVATIDAPCRRHVVTFHEGGSLEVALFDDEGFSGLVQIENAPRIIHIILAKKDKEFYTEACTDEAFAISAMHGLIKQGYNVQIIEQKVDF